MKIRNLAQAIETAGDLLAWINDQDVKDYVDQQYDVDELQDKVDDVDTAARNFKDAVEGAVQEAADYDDDEEEDDDTDYTDDEDAD